MKRYLTKDEALKTSIFKGEAWLIINADTKEVIQSDSTEEKARANADVLNDHNRANGHAARFVVVERGF